MEETWPKLAEHVVRRAAPNQSRVMIGRLLTCVLNLLANVVGSPGQFMRKQIIQLVNGLVALYIGMFFFNHHGFFAGNTIPTSVL